MGDRQTVTRRALLGSAAAAGAATLIRPGASRAAAVGAGRVSSRWVGSLAGESAPLRAPREFSLVGVQWDEPAAAKIELRAQTPAGGFSPWAVASVLGHDADSQSTRAGREHGAGRNRGAGRGALFGEPMWTGAADSVQLRSDRPVAGLTLHFVTALRDSGARAAAVFPLAQPLLDAGPGQPPIIARSAWAQGHAPTGGFAGYGTVKLGFVHHTVNPNGYSAGEVPGMLLAIFDYHRYVRGFLDIAYNFLVDLYGRIWEGRAGGIDMAVVGAQAGGYNTESTGAAVLGDFENVVPSQAALAALQRLLAWKLSLHGVPTHGRVTVVVDPADYFYTPFGPGAHVSLPRVAGHRQGDSTDCPGNAFFARLPSLRPQITALAGTPARLTANGPSAVVTAGTPVTVSGLLTELGGGPLAGAPIELQQLASPGVATARNVIATASTGSDGSWSASVPLSTNAALRGVHTAFPAAVADWVYVAVAPAIALTLVSASPLEVSGTISPPKPHVTIALYAGTVPQGKPLKRKVVAATAGQFETTLSVPGPGSYVLVATHVADDANMAGRSAPLVVTVT